MYNDILRAVIKTKRGDFSILIGYDKLPFKNDDVVFNLNQIKISGIINRIVKNYSDEGLLVVDLYLDDEKIEGDNANPDTASQG